MRDVIENHYEEARQRALSLLEDTRETAEGCWVTNTAAPRKVTFRGHQLPAYRFVHCVLERHIVGRDWVVRHRCHNRLCMRPEHLILGTQADNKRDDWEYWAGGVDHRFL
ncbi:hypothetical protein GQ651_17010 [Alphaproteobacteria bacterium GH1-50]|uniref:HNH nuclease domain-containing protein n=2 Tax=Kangsaoukella pontilimi TaxID=2691042 RepID=A0A7C9II63_9RHOB|nr:hypothetical protein [Kangsaoukella pontilimi]